jgi:hypothetical protein
MPALASLRRFRTHPCNVQDQPDIAGRHPEGCECAGLQLEGQTLCSADWACSPSRQLARFEVVGGPRLRGLRSEARCGFRAVFRIGSQEPPNVSCCRRPLGRHRHLPHRAGWSGTSRGPHPRPGGFDSCSRTHPPMRPWQHDVPRSRRRRVNRGRDAVRPRPHLRWSGCRRTLSPSAVRLEMIDARQRVSCRRGSAPPPALRASAPGGLPRGKPRQRAG